MHAGNPGNFPRQRGTCRLRLESTGVEGAWRPTNTDAFATRGFLPRQDPARAFPCGSRHAMLDELGACWPEHLRHFDFRERAERLSIPEWIDPVTPETLPLLRLYYVRVGFL